MIRQHPWIVLLALLSFGVVSCGAVAPNGGPDGGDAGHSSLPPVPIDEYVEAMAHARCDRAADCCTKNAQPFGLTQCLAHERDRLQTWMTTTQASGAIYDSDAGARCIAQTAADLVACEDDYITQRTNFLACKDVFGGVGKKLGEDCAGIAECDLSPDGVVQCLGGPGRASTTCTLLTVGKAGDSCALDGTTISDCGLDSKYFFCADGLEGVCAPLKGLGEECHVGECVRGTRCDGGACVAGLPVGSACVDSGCDSASYCDSTSNICTKSVAPGLPCTPSQQCLDGSCYDGKCLTSRWAESTSVCVAE